jgi:predicted nuclease of restriction endonuclease-like (RecB) superfamily
MPKNKLTPASNTAVDKDYQALVQELQGILTTGQYTAYKAVDNIKVQTYWQMGERIVREELKNKDRADYGEYLVENLAVDLGIAKQRLHEIVKFYRVFPIIRTVSGQLSWSHYLELIGIDDDKKRGFYQNKSIQNSWSVRGLRKHIKSNLYENITPQERQETFQTKLPAETSLDVFKDVLDFNPLGLESNDDERKMETKLVKNIDLFLKELGENFAFIGRQVPIKIAGQTHNIDLVLYHRGIPCVVLVELKIGKFNSQDVGQINKYIGYYRKNKQFEHERDTIGLIICQEADHEEVVYALDGLEDKIFVAQYKAKLPSEQKIKKILQKL